MYVLFVYITCMCGVCGRRSHEIHLVKYSVMTTYMVRIRLAGRSERSPVNGSEPHESLGLRSTEYS